MEVVDGRVFSTTSSLLFNVIFCLFVLTLLNLLFKKLFTSVALSQGELTVIYVMLCMGSAISGQGLLQVLTSTLGHPFWFATPENEWKELFFRYIPNWLAVEDKSVLEGYYNGNSSFSSVGKNVKVKTYIDGKLFKTQEGGNWITEFYDYLVDVDYYKGKDGRVVEREFITPLGRLTEKCIFKASSNSVFLSEFPIKRLEDYEIFSYMINDLKYEIDNDYFQKENNLNTLSADVLLSYVFCHFCELRGTVGKSLGLSSG